MVELKMGECCIENKQLTTASSSSVSEGGGSAVVKSPGISSPAPISPNHRYCPLITFFFFAYSNLLYNIIWQFFASQLGLDCCVKCGVYLVLLLLFHT